jgi:hypothetical protein
MRHNLVNADGADALAVEEIAGAFADAFGCAFGNAYLSGVRGTQGSFAFCHASAP